MEYESVVVIESKVRPSVTFAVRRISFGRRLELIRRIREMAQKYEFLEAGGSVKEKMEATELAAEIDRVYLSWGLERIEGLTVDGVVATPESLIASGPEDLCREIIGAIKSECGLSEAERKN